ncbi:hypothetical protein EMCRGX_G013730 [Ephydatia muelleri]
MLIQQYDATRYTQLAPDYVQNVLCAKSIINCVAIFDAVWAYAVALNNSIDALQKIGLTLSNCTFGEEKCTQIIQQQMYMLNFSGIVGNSIRFDPLNGYISSVLTNVFNINREIVANYTISDGIEFDPAATAVFVATGFVETYILVSPPLSGVISVVDMIGVLLVLGIHVMNTVYRNHKAIKASSSRLNHFAYIGCYLILLATLLYTITEIFPVSMQYKSILCNAFPWSLIIGLTLVFGAVTAKTWRAIKKKEFQMRSIIVLAYLLTLTTVVGGVIYWIAVIVEAGVNTSYGILAFLLTVMDTSWWSVLLCLAAPVEGVLVEEEVVLVALAVVAVLVGLLLEVGFQNPSAQQAELPTAHCEVAQSSVYAVHHCSHLPQLMVGYEVVDDLHEQL